MGTRHPPKGHQGNGFPEPVDRKKVLEVVQAAEALAEQVAASRRVIEERVARWKRKSPSPD